MDTLQTSPVDAMPAVQIKTWTNNDPLLARVKEMDGVINMRKI